MARKERTSKGRTMRPNYFVFCEGETEVAYTEMLRGWYRLPIHIIAKKTSLNVTPALVERCKALYVQTKADKTYLMYDLDVEGVLERLQKVPEATLLCSNPCFELWLLLHYASVKAALKSDVCVTRLEKFVKQYRKGELSTEVQSWLREHVFEAMDRAQGLEAEHVRKDGPQAAFGNPSTTVYRLVEDLERMKLKQMVMAIVRDAGSDGVTVEMVYEGIKQGARYGHWSKEQHLRSLGNILSEMNSEGTIVLKGKQWHPCE